MRARVILAVNLVAVLVAACGGGEGGSKSDADLAKEQAQGLFKDLSRGDNDKACARLTAKARKDFENEISIDSPTFLGENAPEIEFPKATNVDVNGSTAKVEIVGRGGSAIVELVKEDEAWFVQDFGG